jgi:hypothetical protein
MTDAEVMAVLGMVLARWLELGRLSLVRDGDTGVT